MTQTTALAADCLTVSFGSTAARIRAVDNVSFAVPRGGTFGLIGESGCGKSTVLRALSGLIETYAGAVLLDGRELSRRRERAFFKHVQMVFQDPYGSLHPRKMVDAVLDEPLAIHGFDDREARLVDALLAVGLGPEFRFRYPHQLSGGQRQRVAIARALALEPEIVLLDEPTSALDVSVQAEILNLLTRLQRERGLTYVMVSHDLAVVAHVCAHIAVMNAGRIVETLTAAELRAGHATEPYTRELLEASRGYGQGAAPAVKAETA